MLILGVSGLGVSPWVDRRLHLGWLHVRCDSFVDSSDRVTGLVFLVGVGGGGGGR